MFTLKSAESAPAAAARPLRIVFLLSSLWLSGGVQAVVEYANRLTARGHTVALVTPKGTVDPAVAARLAPAVRVIESSRARPARAHAANLAALAFSLAHAAPRSDLIIATHTPTTASSALACTLLRRGAPVWLFMDYAQMFAGRRAEGWLLRHALRWHRLAITISQATADELARYAPGRIEVVGLGISNLDLLTPVYAEQRPAGPPRLFYLGDARPRKGLADFLHAAEIVHAARPDLELVIAAKDACAIETTVPYTFVAKPDRAALARLFQSCTAYVSASWVEGLGYPPLEAMACATPVVMTATGGSQEYAVHGGNCLLTPPRAPAALAAAILRLLDDPLLQRTLSHAGPPTAARFGWEPVIDRLEACLYAAARGGRTPRQRTDAAGIRQ